MSKTKPNDKAKRKIVSLPGPEPIRAVQLKDLATSVVRVGDGRGFIVATRDTAYVITAAHCLPQLPPPHLGRSTEEETFAQLVGPLGTKPTITIACLFADPIADVAVFGPPEVQALSEEAEAYQRFTAALPPFDIAAPPPRQRVRLPSFEAPPSYAPHDVKFPAHILGLDGDWLECTAHRAGRPLWIEPERLTGMSGSPLVSSTGAALAVISTNNMAACLVDSLPGWLVRELTA